MRQPHTSTKIYEDLKRKITGGEIRSGEYLIESKLTEEYGASRSPVRKALSLLDEDGLVTSVPRKGTYVKFLNTEDVIEVYQAAEALEGMAVFLFASQKVRDTKQLSVINQKMQEALERYDIPTWCILDEKFHELIFQSCGNSIIIRLYSTLSTNMRRVRSFYSSIWHDKKQSCLEHDQILDRIDNGDPANARIIIQNHYRSVINQAVIVLGLETNTNMPPMMPIDELLTVSENKEKAD